MTPIWSDLMKVRHIYLRGRGIKINNGQYVNFWLDPWLNDTPLCQRYLILYEMATKQRCYVKEVKENGWLIQFKTRL
jgi:hypothetical protein